MGRGLVIGEFPLVFFHPMYSNSYHSGPHAFLSTYTHPIPVQAFRALLPHILTLSRGASTPASIREAVGLFRAAVGRLRASSSEAGAEEAVGETREAILALPRARKTAGGGHRAVLYGMLGCLEAPSGDKNDGVSALLALFASETAPEAAEALGGVLERWIGASLSSDEPTKKAEEAGAAVMRGMGLKTGAGAAGVRRAWWMLGAGVLWNGPLSSETYVAFARALVPALDAALGAVGTGIGAKEEALWEACLSAACLLRLAGGTGGKSGELAKHVTNLAVVRAIVVPVGDKPVWLFNERVYSRVGISKDAVGSDAHDQEALWLVRALQGVWAVSASGAGYVLGSRSDLYTDRKLARTCVLGVRCCISPSVRSLRHALRCWMLSAHAQMRGRSFARGSARM